MREHEFRALIVWLIVSGETEKALRMLSERYHVETPKLTVGLPKGRKKNNYGCYSTGSRGISVRDSDVLKEPFVILHEFYHHIRTGLDAKHRGTEKHANRFAEEFIQAYNDAMKH